MDDEIPIAPLPERKKKEQTSLKEAAKGASKSPPSGEHRRGFFSAAMAVVIGGFVSLVPMAAGLMTFFDPLRRKSGAAKSIRVAPLHAIPSDGTPVSFPVIADRSDAWNKFPNDKIGSVFLRRITGKDGQPKVQAFNAICPHAGCMVAFNGDRKEFKCPCHTSAFQVDGARIDPEHCPSPRDLDELECEVVTSGKEQAVMVKFTNFYAGMAEKKAKA
jgi:menaquinol-cytochrome c reductase iron-sulfur subunit